MLIIPAIDLKEGKCVRLEQGLMDKATVYSDDPRDHGKALGSPKVQSSCMSWT